MHDDCQICSGSGQSSLNRLRVSEFKVLKKHGNRGGGASQQVSVPAFLKVPGMFKHMKGPLMAGCSAAH